MTEAVRPNRARRFARTLKSRPSDVIKIAESNGLRATQDAPIASPARPETKISRVIRLLQQSDGASLDELAATTGWQPHTTRAAITGLKKKGHEIAKHKVGGVTRYSINVSTGS